jgi:hypothetical protein
VSDNITLPRELVFRAVKALSPMAYDTWPRERNEVVEALRTHLAAPEPEPVRYPEKRPALEVYNEIAATDDPGSPLERLRFFCSLAMRPQDWLDVEPFFDALREPEKKAAPTPRTTCGFVDVRFDGERWFCGKCGERMPANYEAMVKHYSGDREHLELMQRKAAFKMGGDKT